MSEQFKINTKKYPPVPFKQFPGGMLAAQIGPEGGVWLIVQCAVPVNRLHTELADAPKSEILSFGHPEAPFHIQGTAEDFLRYANDAEREVTE